MNAKQKIVHGRGPSNINLGVFVCSFDVCRASKPFPSINYAATEYGKTQTSFFSALGSETEEQIKLAKDKIRFDYCSFERVIRTLAFICEKFDNSFSFKILSIVW